MHEDRTGREPRSALANLGVFLAVLPFNVLPAGYAWLAVGIGGWAATKNGEEPTVPVWEIAGSGSVLVAVAVGLAWGRFRAAAVAQVGLTAVLMTWLLSAYH
ncbi:hypothetical protein OG596_05345 [Streptomyces sp. NBC_01102]|uniref:hypothetical protein n=1 Tax=Streptomyces sp. NBC_01102 TaxID=2903749 RepID=UPI00386B63FA|nr:hypothetical protein OG596_05345 [Streptomyces sp. NBC_01102]